MAREGISGARIVAALNRSRRGRSTGELAELFGMSASKMTDRLTTLEKRGEVVREGISDRLGDAEGTPLWRARAEPS